MTDASSGIAAGWPPPRRVVVTGMGMLSALGNDVPRPGRA